MPFADCNGFRMYYEEAGQGTPIVFLHGFTLDGRMWAPQTKVFAERFRVIIPDARGHGKSDAPPGGYSRAHRVEDLLAFADTLELERFHLVGLSMGGSTAVGFALGHQDRLLSLALVSTGIAGYKAGRKMERLDRIGRNDGPDQALRLWKKWSLSWYRELERAHLREPLEEMMNEYSGVVWRDPMRGKYPREYDLEHVHEITVPTAIFAGALDKVFVPLAQELHEKISSSILTIYDRVGHMLNLEAPTHFNADLQLFLEGGH